MLAKIKKILTCAFVASSISAFGEQGQIAQANGIDIWYETFGNQNDPALLLIMGGRCQGILWPVEFCKKLIKEGFYVIRYDHRDTGYSTCFDFKKEPYDILDLTKDAIGLLNNSR